LGNCRRASCASAGGALRHDTADKPRYLILIRLDEPKAVPGTHGYATAGWNAVPTGGKVIARIAPLLGVAPRFDLPTADKLILASAGGGR
jgi:cell division protein FtsI (penicillin-binding protein 3)